jgi:hypothetical protein
MLENHGDGCDRIAYIPISSAQSNGTLDNHSVAMESSFARSEPVDNSVYYSAYSIAGSGVSSTYDRAIGNEIHTNHTLRVEATFAINENQTKDSHENGNVCPTANGSASCPLAPDTDENGRGRFAFLNADFSKHELTYKDQAMDRNEENFHGNGAVENDAQPIAYATQVSEPEERVEQAHRDPSPSPMPAVNNRESQQRFRNLARREHRQDFHNQTRHPERIHCPNWFPQWGAMLVVAILVVLAVVVAVVVNMSNHGATTVVPLISTPVPHQAAPRMAVPPSTATAIATTTTALSPPIPDTVPQPTFSFDSTASRATNIMNYVNSVTLSGRRLVPDNADTSPVEERTLYWIVNVDELSLVTDTDENQGRIAQRYALATLWAAGGQWSNQQSALNECEWDGVTCATVSNGLVTEIDLSVTDDWNGNGGMSPDLALATALMHIDLSGKSLTGSLPKSLGRLTNLVSFEVQQNGLTGTLPESIGDWTKLERFSVYDNALTGTIPGSIVQWTKIQSALFDSNKFSGSVPEGICQFRSVDLTLLNADCGTKVACNCCTYCM